MELNVYQTNTSRTCADLGSLKLNLSHMCLGMFSEWNEVIEAYKKGDEVNISEELADIMWYVSNYCNYRDINLKTISPSGSVDIIYHMSKLSDLVKKYVAYGKEINRQEELACIVSIVLGIQSSFNAIENITMEQALENNINKLKVRYPDKFSEEYALNRDLERERVELEK